MHLRARIEILSCLLLLALAANAGAQQRIEFQRQKFDRSRFERPDPSARPSAPEAAAPASEPAAEPVGAFAPAAPAPLPTEPPATSSSSVFAYSNAPAETAPPAPAPAATNTAIFSADSVLPSGPPPTAYPPDATPEEKAAIDNPLFDQVPTKWFRDADEYPELLALQKKTGACLLVYFKNPSVPNEKGLCSWFEKSITTDIDWRKAMKYFIKLEITFPGGSAVRDLAAEFKAVKTPGIYIVKPGSTLKSRILVFDYPPGGGRPTPIEVPVVLQNVKTRCTPAYQNLF